MLCLQSSDGDEVMESYVRGVGSSSSVPSASARSKPSSHRTVTKMRRKTQTNSQIKKTKTSRPEVYQASVTQSCVDTRDLYPKMPDTALASKGAKGKKGVREWAYSKGSSDGDYGQIPEVFECIKFHPS